MASFKFRWPGSAGQGDSPDRSQRDAPPTLATLRRRARNRLVGALFLVVLAVLALPWLFDTGPRPVAVDIPIVIPSQDETPPLDLPPPAGEQTAAEEPVQLPPALPDDATAAQMPPATEAPVDEVGDEPSTLPPAGQTEVASATPAPVVAAPPTAPDDGARALALLEGRASPSRSASVPATATNGRFVVQVGAFSDASRVKAVRQKLEKAGFSTYTQEVETAAGKNTRVRVGPFATRADADRVAAGIRELDLPAAVLSLPKG